MNVPSRGEARTLLQKVSRDKGLARGRQQCVGSVGLWRRGQAGACGCLAVELGWATALKEVPILLLLGVFSRTLRLIAAREL